VWVHPFRNGNGRWARLACDAVAVRLHKEAPIVWATSDLVLASQERTRYIAALRAADHGDAQPLIEYLTDHNPDRA
jgi:fido (protein-threonine AMPylation protein)